MDVYHLLLGLAVALDDRVWPREDRDDVQLFISLVHHVTGVRLRASFASEGEPAAAGLWGWQHRGGQRMGRRRQLGATLRRMGIRFRAHIWPYNSGTTAGEALVAPFFAQTRDEVPPPVAAATLDVLFPRSSPAVE